MDRCIDLDLSELLRVYYISIIISVFTSCSRGYNMIVLVAKIIFMRTVHPLCL